MRLHLPASRASPSRLNPEYSVESTAVRGQVDRVHEAVPLREAKEVPTAHSSSNSTRSPTPIRAEGAVHAGDAISRGDACLSRAGAATYQSGVLAPASASLSLSSTSLAGRPLLILVAAFLNLL